MTISQIFAIIAACSMILSMFFEPLWNFWEFVYHKICDLFGICYHPYGEQIKFVEQYIDKDGNEFDADELTSEEFHKRLAVHHTFKVYYCSKCGKVFRTEQLQ